MSVEKLSPLNYTLDRVTVSATRAQTEQVHYDITRSVAEINIYENMNIPYLTGSLLIVDSSAMSSIINYNGTETVTIELTPQSGPAVQVSFNVFALTDMAKAKANDSVSTYTLQLIEPHGFLSNFKRLRKGYSGNITAIIKQILSESLGVEVPDENFEDSYQSIQVVVPNLTPLGACKWLAERATSEFGEPMYLYSSIRGGLHFNSLGSLVAGDRRHPDPFAYSSGPIGSTDFARASRSIQQMSIPENDNIIRLARDGAIASRFYSIDPFTRNVDYVDYNAKANFDERGAAGRTMYPTLQLDTSFQLPDGALSETDSYYFSQVTTSSGFDKIAAYDEESDYQRHITKVSSRSIDSLIHKQEMTVVVPGFHMMRSAENLAVGNIVGTVVNKDQPAHQERSSEALIDKRRSGNWIIGEARHRFNMASKYVVACTLWRATSEDTLTASEQGPE
jgi:hypothetical protein